MVMIKDGTGATIMNTQDEHDLLEEVEQSLVASGQLVGNVQRVTTAGTKVQLGDLPCKEVTVIALKANTGSIYVGDSRVSNTVFGVELAANESFTFAINNANLIHLTSSVNGEGVSYVAI
jgi:hypothetical protein